MGHVYAWMLHDCSGNAAAHRDWFPRYEERRAARQDLTPRFMDDPHWDAFDGAERPYDAALDDEFGEPRELARR